MNDREKRLAELHVRLEREHVMRQNHRAELESRYGTETAAKREKLYELAWGFGHSGGLSEVEYYYAELAGLVR